LKLSLFAIVIILGAWTGRVWAGDLPDIAPAAGWDNLPPLAPDANDWPWWRGPTLDNSSNSPIKPPLQWSATQNVLWHTALAGRGHSTPCIWGPHIFLTAGDPAQQTIWIECRARASGKQLWQTQIYHGPFPRVHTDNSAASATPACDGQRVFVPYQTADQVCLAAVDLEGKVVWNLPLGPYTSIQGYSASPAFYKSAVIIPTDGPLGNHLTAVHRQTGQVVWRNTMRPVKESYATPLVAHVAGRDQLVLIGGQTTRSYDPNNGQLFWECAGPADVCAATAAFGPDTIYATGGYPQRNLLAIKADGSGDVTKTHLRWHGDNKVGYIPSPLLYEGLLYCVSDKGLMRCYDALTGQIIWDHDFDMPFYSSPVRINDRIYLFDRKGHGYVMQTGRSAQLLATNELPAGAFATPVILQGKIFLRTLRELYCLGE